MAPPLRARMPAIATRTPMTNPLSSGSPYPLGTAWDGLGVNFAVFSAHAEQIDLCLFDPSGRREIARMPLPEHADEIFHGYLPDARAGLLYGFRAHGPYDPQHGHRFNPNKLLLDPYAKQISGEVRWSDALYGYRLHSPRGDLSYDRRDSAPGMPKGVVIDAAFNWGDDRPPNTPWEETVIYEAHVRGLTMLRQDIRPHERGTFAALASAPMIAHYRRLGVTAIELMPIHAFVQDRRLVELGLRNYWGYNSLAFFAPEPRYLADGSLNELKVAIRRLHAAGLEVILDVVYNHTAENGEDGPTLSFRGLDNLSYYRLQANDRRRCVNDTGCGNTVDLTHPRVLQLVMDSLRYWVEAFHVDGFRFDLGVTLGRESYGFDPGSGFFDAVRQDPVLSRVKLIAEPWDIGPGGYQLGRHPPGFAEWNDKFRDSVRRFWRGDGGQRPELAARISASSDLFDRRSRRPWASINFVASHDGFTLGDATAYVERHNRANGEDNRDGHGENYTANWGVEGRTADAAILATRAMVARAMLTTTLFANGTPMLLAGDEFGRTQQGNNNAYAQDNAISWVDWTRADSEAGRDMIAFVSRLLALRRAHPILRCKKFLHGKEEPAPGVLDLAWFDERGAPIRSDAWNDPGERTLSVRRAARREDGAVPILTLMLNPTPDDRSFTLPQPSLETVVLVDSAMPAAAERPVDGDGLTIAARSAVLALSLAAPTGRSEPRPHHGHGA